MSDIFDRLNQQLANPLHSVGIAELLELWQHDDVIVECVRPRELEDCPDLPLRMRGALGNALEAVCAHASSQRDSFGRPSAHDLMFRWKPPNGFSTPIATPYVIRAEVRGNLVEARVRLFGFAAFYGPVVLVALCNALSSGVSLRNYGVRAVFTVKTGRIERFAGATRTWQQTGSGGKLHLLTPVVIRQGQNIRITPLSFMRSVIRRATAVAPWMYCELDHKGAEPLVKADRIAFSMEDIHAECWSRTSRRNPGRALPVEGYAGSITITGNLEVMAPYLDLAQYVSVGGETALGFGAIRAVFYP